jgi:hypothetical protein
MKDLGLLVDAKIVIGNRAFDMKAGDRVVLRKNLADRLLEAKFAAEVPREMAFKELF